MAVVPGFSIGRAPRPPSLASLVGTSGPFNLPAYPEDEPFDMLKIDDTHFIKSRPGAHSRAFLYTVNNDYSITEEDIADTGPGNHLRNQAGVYLGSSNLYVSIHPIAGTVSPFYDGIHLATYPVNTSTWVIDDSSPISDTEYLTSTLSTYDVSIRAVALDDNRVAVAFRLHSEGYIKVYNIDSSGNVTNASPILNYSSGINHVADIVQLGTDHFAVADNVGIRVFYTNPASTHAVSLVDTHSPASYYSEPSAKASLMVNPQDTDELILSQKGLNSPYNGELYIYSFDGSFNIQSEVFSNTNYKSVYTTSDMAEIGTNKFALVGDFETSNRDAWMSVWSLQDDPVEVTLEFEETMYDVSTEAVSERWIGHCQAMQLDTNHLIVGYRVLQDWYFKVYQV